MQDIAQFMSMLGQDHRATKTVFACSFVSEWRRQARAAVSRRKELLALKHPFTAFTPFQVRLGVALMQRITRSPAVDVPRAFRPCGWLALEGVTDLDLLLMLPPKLGLDAGAGVVDSVDEDHAQENGKEQEHAQENGEKHEHEEQAHQEQEQEQELETKNEYVALIHSWTREVLLPSAAEPLRMFMSLYFTGWTTIWKQRGWIQHLRHAGLVRSPPLRPRPLAHLLLTLPAHPHPALRLRTRARARALASAAS